jgi:putative OPT family oligopeptide transporter
MLGAMQVLGIQADPSIIAFALLITGVVFAVAVISNDNLQDLKTGQLVAATPWRQQTALIVGVIAGSLVIPLILDLLNHANGFVGGPPPTVPGAQPLSAPQATLISALAKGVIEGGLRWDLIGIGAAMGVGIIVVDEILNRVSGGKLKLPPLAVGIGIYLPMAVTTMVVVGAVIGTVYNRWVGSKQWGDVAKRLGILLASGMIVGESLFGVLNAGVVVATNTASPFGLIPEGSAWPAMIAAVIGFAAMAYGLYAWTRSQAAKV